MSKMKFLTVLMLGLFISVPVFAQDDAAPADEVVATDVVVEDAAAPADEAIPAGEAVPADDAAPTDEAVEEAPVDGGEVAATDPVDEIVDFEEAIEEAFALVDAIQSKNWPLAVGLGLMLLVFILNKVFNLKEKVGPKALPWIAMAFAVCGTVGTGLIAGLGWVDSIVQGILAGVVAIGGWELLFKHILGNKAKEPTEA